MSDPNGAQALALRQPTGLQAREPWDQSRRDLLARTIAKGATSDELELFIAVCKRTGLDPFAKQIYAIKRFSKAERREVMTIQFGIDGLRLIAERTGKYAGSETHWCGPDGKWVDVWTDLTTPPFAARTTVWKVGVERPFTAVTRWASYAQDTRFWKDSPDNQLGKCSEGLALRKAFPAELAGYHQAAPEIDRTGDRIIDRDTGEIVESDDDAYDRAATEYEAAQQQTSEHVDEQPAPTPIRPAAPATEPMASRAALEQAGELYRACEALGLPNLQGPQRPFTVDGVRNWITYWSAEHDEYIARQATIAHAGGGEDGVEEIEPEDAWEELKKQPPVEPTLPLEASGPTWGASSLGQEISRVADELAAVNKRFQLPPDGATEAELSGWLAAKRGLLKHKG